MQVRSFILTLNYSNQGKTNNTYVSGKIEKLNKVFHPTQANELRKGIIFHGLPLCQVFQYLDYFKKSLYLNHFDSFPQEN